MDLDEMNSHNDEHQRSGCGCEPPPCGCTYSNSGCGSKKHNKEKKCRSYSFVTKNPYDVGITKSMSNGEFLVLLSGNHHATSDYDKDRLPDWIAIGERPCRQYKNLTTEELVELWGLKKKACNDPCLHRTSFDVCHPNGYVNYYTTDGYNRSQPIEVTDATVDTSQNDHALVLKVKLLHQDGEGPQMDGLYPRMFKVALVLDGFCHKKHDNKRKVLFVPEAPPPAAAPVNISLSDIGSDDGATATGGQATSDVKQTTTATSTATASAAINKEKKKKKKKDKKKKKCDHIKDKKKKKKCLKKLHEHEHKHSDEKKKKD